MAASATMPAAAWIIVLSAAASVSLSLGARQTFGLFLGFVPVYLGYTPPVSAGTGFALASALSLALLWLGIARAR